MREFLMVTRFEVGYGVGMRFNFLEGSMVSGLEILVVWLWRGSMSVGVDEIGWGMGMERFVRRLNRRDL